MHYILWMHKKVNLLKLKAIKEQLKASGKPCLFFMAQGNQIVPVSVTYEAPVSDILRFHNTREVGGLKHEAEHE